MSIAANGRNTHADCKRQLAGIEKLKALVDDGTVVIDDDNLIMDEYKKHLNFDKALAPSAPSPLRGEAGAGGNTGAHLPFSQSCLEAAPKHDRCGTDTVAMPQRQTDWRIEIPQTAPFRWLCAGLLLVLPTSWRLNWTAVSAAQQNACGGIERERSG